MKVINNLVSAISLVGVASALPKSSTKEARATVNDGFILNYALTLEHLEDTFYRTGLQMFSEEDFAQAGFDATFYKNLKEVAYDEKTHVSFLTGALTGRRLPALVNRTTANCL